VSYPTGTEVRIRTGRFLFIEEVNVTRKKLISYQKICLILTLLALPGPVLAQSANSAPSEEAKEHFQRGKNAYSQGDHELAIKEWETAYSIDPRPQIRYNLAQAYERLGKLSEAAQALEYYIANAGSKDSDYLPDARAALASIQARLARTGVIIQGGPDGASIFVDEQPWGRTPRPDKIALSPGNHRIAVRQQGYRDFISDVVVPAGQVIEIAVTLEPEGGKTTAGTAGAAQTGQTTASDTTSPPPSSTSSGKRTNPLPWFIAAGAAGTLMVGSLIWFINRNSAVSDCQKPKVLQACLNESTIKTERTAAVVTTAVLGAGAVAALIVGLVVNAGNPDERPPSTACVPSLQGLGCSFTF
jgi:hypothetical protein